MSLRHWGVPACGRGDPGLRHVFMTRLAKLAGPATEQRGTGGAVGYMAAVALTVCRGHIRYSAGQFLGDVTMTLLAVCPCRVRRSDRCCPWGGSSVAFIALTFAFLSYFDFRFPRRDLTARRDHPRDSDIPISPGLWSPYIPTQGERYGGK